MVLVTGNTSGRIDISNLNSNFILNYSDCSKVKRSRIAQRDGKRSWESRLLQLYKIFRMVMVKFLSSWDAQVTK